METGFLAELTDKAIMQHAFSHQSAVLTNHWEPAVSLHERMKQILSTASFRGDADYSKEIPKKAKYGALLYYRDSVGNSRSFVAGRSIGGHGDEWLRQVLREFSHAHYEVNEIAARGLGSLNDPMFVLSSYLLDEHTPSSHFLDFLELSLDPALGYPLTCDNDFVKGLNLVLDRRGSPYLLTSYKFVHEVPDDGSFDPFARRTTVTACPKAYLKQSSSVQQTALEPALELLADPAYDVPSRDFLKALERQRHGDYDGVLTSCAATLEGAIKTAAQANGWKIRGMGLGTVFQSFSSKSKSIPNELKSVVNFLHERRSKVGDAHGHMQKSRISGEEAAFVIALTASLVSYLSAAK